MLMSDVERSGVPWPRLKRMNRHRTSAPTDRVIRSAVIAVGRASPPEDRRPVYADAVILAAFRLLGDLQDPAVLGRLTAEVNRVESEMYQSGQE